MTARIRKGDRVVVTTGRDKGKKGEVLPKIHGDQADTTMNYRFRNAILGFFGTVDHKGFPDDGQSDQPPRAGIHSRFQGKFN